MWRQLASNNGVWRKSAMAKISGAKNSSSSMAISESVGDRK